MLIPIEIMGMLVKPFALTMRLAANMTGGHIALLALLSLMAIFAELFHSLFAGVGGGPGLHSHGGGHFSPGNYCCDGSNLRLYAVDSCLCGYGDQCSSLNNLTEVS